MTKYLSPRPRPKRPPISRTDALTWPHAAGTPVVVRNADGSETHARTSSEAWNLFRGCGLVRVHGYPGNVSLDRVTLDKSGGTTLAVTVVRRTHRAPSKAQEQLPLLEQSASKKKPAHGGA